MKAKTLTTLNGVNKEHITIFNSTVTVIGQRTAHPKGQEGTSAQREATTEVNMTLQRLKHQSYGKYQ